MPRHRQHGRQRVRPLDRECAHFLQLLDAGWPDLQLTLQEVFSGAESIVIVFDSTTGIRVAVTLIFDDDMKITRYITPGESQGLAIAGQPAVQYYFHRPLSVLFGACFEAGFVLDGLEEPVFAETTEPNRELSWAHFKEIPVVMAARLRIFASSVAPE